MGSVEEMPARRCQMNMRFPYSPDFVALNLAKKMGEWLVGSGTASEEILILFDDNDYLKKMPSGVTLMRRSFQAYDMTANGPDGASRIIFDYDGSGTCVLFGGSTTLTLDSTVGNRRTYTMTNPSVDSVGVVFVDVQITAITEGNHPTNFRIYPEKYAAEVAAGQVGHPKFLEFHGVPSLTRWMEAQGINSSPLTKWRDKPPENTASWASQRFKAEYWAGNLTNPGKNKFISNTTIAGNPTAWENGQIVHVRFTDADVIVPIQAITKGATTSIRADGHGIVGSEYIRFDPFTIYFALSSSIVLATRVDDNNFTIPVDSTSHPNFTSGNFYHLHTLETTTLPPVTMSAANSLQFGSGDIAATAVRTFVYDELLDMLIMAPSGNAGGLPASIPFEASLDITAEMGREAWISVPLNFDNDAITNLATLCRDRRPSLPVHIELSNEIWNTGGPFGQTNWAAYKAIAQWPSLISQFYNNWYGKRYQEIMEIFTSTFSAAGQTSRLTRWFGVWHIETANTTKTHRIDSPQHFTDTGKRARDYIDAICYGNYFSSGLTDAEWLEWGYKYSLGGSDAEDALAFLNGRTTGDTGSHPYAISKYTAICQKWADLAATFVNDKGLHPMVGAYEGADENNYLGGDGTYGGHAVTAAMVFNLIMASRQRFGYIWYKKYFDGHIAAGGSLPSQYAGVGSFYSVTNPWSLKDNLFRFVNEGAFLFMQHFERGIRRYRLTTS